MGSEHLQCDENTRNKKEFYKKMCEGWYNNNVTRLISYRGVKSSRFRRVRVAFG